MHNKYDQISKFPPGALQLEIGIQTLNNDIALNINRKLDIPKIKDNIDFLQNHTNAHMHLDLIIGLPGESIESFAQNLNTLTSISECEIQIGILKKLSGTSIERHDKDHNMIYSDTPPYEIMQNDHISFKQMQQLKRFARFWDMVYNSGNFKNSVKLIWKDRDVYSGFFDFSLWLYDQTESTWKISLDRLAELLYNYLVCKQSIAETDAAKSILNDIMKINGRKIPKFLRKFNDLLEVAEQKDLTNLNKRQLRHL